MKIYEYRVICPCTLEQYRIGSIYMTAKRSEEETKHTKGEGIETVKSEHFDDERGSGTYTYKIMHFKSRIPSFMRWALPDKYCHCHEKSWNAYPHYHTEYSVPGMGENLIMTIDSDHIPYKNGEDIPDNLLNLSKDELAMRKVVYLDILDGKPKPDKGRDLTNWSCTHLNVNEKFSSFSSSQKTKKEKKEAGESKPPEWTKNFNGEMVVAVKVLRMKFHWRGLQTIVEKFATTNFYHNLFLDNHRAMFSWADKWAPMSIDDVRQFEAQIYNQNNALGFERDDSKPDVEPPNVKPAGVPSEPDLAEQNESY